jgi:hypothetical protein
MESNKWYYFVFGIIRDSKNQVNKYFHTIFSPSAAIKGLPFVGESFTKSFFFLIISSDNVELFRFLVIPSTFKTII